MQIGFSKNFRTLSAVIFVAAVLLLAAFSGINKGKQLAEAQTVEQTARNLFSALQFFYHDQERYPTALEFEDRHIMLNYLNNFSLPVFSSKICSQNFFYKRASLNGFQLSFCLPAPVKSYSAGWNTINGSPSAKFN